MADALTHQPAAASLLAGVARRDITPPVGIYNRMWGAAAHDTADGVHRPITATVLAMRSQPGAPPLLLAALDWCIVAEPQVLQMLLEPLLALTGGDESRVVLACTHTHGVGQLGASRADLPGGELIAAYLERARDAIAAAAEEAAAPANAAQCTLTVGTGRCDLAANRDLPDPAAGATRYLCGFNPANDADDTVLVGRLTADDADDRTVAVLVNYACHPTTLAWENTVLSPDYIGGLRELVEAETGAPLLFLQGASGELAPRHQYVGDPLVADGHGRQLGYSVLSVLAGMLAPRQRLAFTGAMESGAPLAVWRPQPFSPSDVIEAIGFSVAYPLKPEYTTDQLAEGGGGKPLDARVLEERVRRRNRVLSWTGNHSPASVPGWAWRIGDLVLLAQPCEAYSGLQMELRARFGDVAVMVANVANGTAGYLPPDQLYEHDIYQVWQTPFERGSAGRLLAAATEAIASLVPQPTAAGAKQ